MARLFSAANWLISGRMDRLSLIWKTWPGKTNNPVASARLEPSGLLEPLAGAAHVNTTFLDSLSQPKRDFCALPPEVALNQLDCCEASSARTCSMSRAWALVTRSSRACCGNAPGWL